MYELNIFKEKLHERAFIKKAAQIRILLYFLFAGVIAAMGIRTMMLTATWSIDSKRIVSLNNGVDTYRKKYAVAKLEEEWGGYVGQLHRLKAVTQNRTTWAMALRELSSIIPARVCVQNLGMSGDGTTYNLMMDVMISVRDRSGYEVANSLISALKKSRYLSGDIRLVSQERTVIEGRDFELARLALSITVKK
jgi:Tfp pilus assembly protein PilN